MSQKIQFALLIGMLVMSVPVGLVINSTRNIDSTPQAAEKGFHSSFSPSADGVRCLIDDVTHEKNVHPGQQITLKAGISGGSGVYTLKWKAQDKNFDTSAVDAQGLGTFVDTGTPVSTMNPTVWFAPSSFRDTESVEIKLFVYDQQIVGSETSCALVYAVENTDPKPIPSVPSTQPTVPFNLVN